jgi:hypothetical protein
MNRKAIRDFAKELGQNTTVMPLQGPLQKSRSSRNAFVKPLMSSSEKDSLP